MVVLGKPPVGCSSDGNDSVTYILITSCAAEESETNRKRGKDNSTSKRQKAADRKTRWRKCPRRGSATKTASPSSRRSPPGSWPKVLELARHNYRRPGIVKRLSADGDKCFATSGTGSIA